MAAKLDRGYAEGAHPIGCDGLVGLVWNPGFSQFTWIFRYRRSLRRRSSKGLMNSAELRPCCGAASVTHIWPVHQWIEPNRWLCLFVPGIWTTGWRPLGIHIRPILGLVRISTSSC
jgi:hypothetical protein